jgi:hypothetical protein
MWKEMRARSEVVDAKGKIDLAEKEKQELA